MSDVIGRGVIEVDIDSGGIKAGVAEGKRSLADLAKAAEQSGGRAAKSVESIASGSDKAARQLEQSTRSMINSIQRQIAVMEAGSKGSAKYYEAIAKQRGISTDAIKPYLDQLESATIAQRAVGISAGQTANALRMIPAQFTDIATGLASGQSPLLVMIQQGGQLKDSFGGIGPAAKAMGGYVAGLLGPFTIATAAIAALALAYKQGSDEQTAFTESLVATGNAAGVSTSQLAAMAASIGGNVGTTHKAAAALAQLVGTGRIYGDQLQGLAASAIAWEQATGTAVEETIKQFAELAKDPVGTSERLNESYNYLTQSIYQQITSLKDQGRAQEAAVLAEKTFSSALNERSKEIQQSLGLIESAWRAVEGSASKAWDVILGVGREATLDEQIAKLNKLRGYAMPWKREDIDKDLAALAAQKLVQEGNAAMWAEERRVHQEGISAERAIEKIRDETLSNAEKREKEIADYRRNIEKIRVANPDSSLLDPAKIDRDIANIRDKFKDPKIFDTVSELSKQLDEAMKKSSESFYESVARDNKNYISGLESSVEAARASVASTSEFLMTDEQRLAQSYERRQAMLDEAHEYGLISEERFQQLKSGLQKKYAEDALAISDNYWDRYLASAKKSLENFDQLSASTVETFSRGFGDAFEKVIFDSQSLSDAFDNLANGMARAVVNALGQMAAQWIAYQAVQLLVGKSAQSIAATQMISNAQATASQAQIAAYASTAAIPYFGPALAPAAAAAAAAFTEPLVAAVSASALSGIAHAGIDNIPREGTWLLNGGERVVAPQQNKDLTQFLSSQKSAPSNQSGGTYHIQIHAVDAQSVERLLNRNGGAVARALASQARNFYRPKG